MTQPLKLISNDAPVEKRPEDLSPLSREIVIGVVAYAGAGCSTAIKRLRLFLETAGYEVRPIKLSGLIAERFRDRTIVEVIEGTRSGPTKFDRACQLQDLGDELRAKFEHFAVASLAVKKIIELRGNGGPGEKKIAYLLDSIKHPDEVDLLRKVYDQSFRLMAVHCERSIREARLIGSATSPAKYGGVPDVKVRDYMGRDEKDKEGRKHGQQVRDAFFLADYFLDNNSPSPDGANLNADLERFVNLLLGSALVRPTRGERAMYHAHAAARQSACLSRQVGAAILSVDGNIVATGANDVPKFGGGVYEEGGDLDHRCHVWEWGTEPKFIGCHNNRKKSGLRRDIGAWLAKSFSKQLAEIAHPRQELVSDIAAEARDKTRKEIEEFFNKSEELFENMPGIKDLIEFSRSIHAEMNALVAAARNGFSPVGATLYCTTYPCHNCARHLVTAGIHQVYYIEPYVKSLATELHEDSITTTTSQPGETQKKMVVAPFTGVGPRMFEDFFTKRTELKKSDGTFALPDVGVPAYAVRLRELSKVEESAASLVGEVADARA